MWAYGVMCWEVFTCGEMPYGRAKNPEVVERVQRGQILPMPPNCPGPVYEEVILFRLDTYIHTEIEIYTNLISIGIL